MASSVAHKRQQCLAAYLECGGNVAQVAAVTGYSTRQIFRYVGDPAFQQEVEGLKRSLVESAANSLRQAAQGAVHVLVKIAHDECAPHASRVQAARSIIAMCIDAATLGDIEQRLRQLEEGKTIDAQPDWNSSDGKIQSIVA